ncbi:hypothetical protein TcCL_Unassigned03532 [Trypanosoma cruzi]|nr:hypothetical protein TcCL_Unassigned03532 [Trypanosoma cruzi]
MQPPLEAALWVSPPGNALLTLLVQFLNADLGDIHSVTRGKPCLALKVLDKLHTVVQWIVNLFHDGCIGHFLCVDAEVFLPYASGDAGHVYMRMEKREEKRETSDGVNEWRSRQQNTQPANAHRQQAIPTQQWHPYVSVRSHVAARTTNECELCLKKHKKYGKNMEKKFVRLPRSSEYKKKNGATKHSRSIPC